MAVLPVRCGIAQFGPGGGPSRPIEFIVRCGPGGGAGQLARELAKLMEPRLKASIPIVNIQAHCPLSLRLSTFTLTRQFEFPRAPGRSGPIFRPQTVLVLVMIVSAIGINHDLYSRRCPGRCHGA
jgi:hypothetical protein